MSDFGSLLFYIVSFLLSSVFYYLYLEKYEWRNKYEKPLVSIIMGIYNCDKYLSVSIESIISQTYTNWELSMCDDGTYNVALKYKEKYGKNHLVKKQR